MSQPQPQPRIPSVIDDTTRSALTVDLLKAGIVQALHYPADANPHYLVKPNQGEAFRRTLWLYGLRCGDCYRQDGDPSGLNDWRKVERA